jgi:tetratricopeptide (TPR) repeat protein
VRTLLTICLIICCCVGAFADELSDCQQEANLDTAVSSCSLIIEGRALGDRASAYKWRGWSYFKKAEYSQAISDYSEAIRLNPADAKSYSNRGDAYNKKGEYNRAITDYDAAIRLNPRDANAYNNRGAAYRFQNNHDRAIADYDEAIRLDPKDSKSYNWRADAYKSKGEYDRAIADYDAAIRLNPKDASAYNNRGAAYYFKGDYDRAIADYDQAVRLDPKSAFPFNNRGAAYHFKRDYEHAIADEVEAIRLAPEFANAYSWRGWSYFRNGDINRAIDDMNRAAKLEPRNAGARERRGFIHLAMGNRSAALDDFNEALRLNNDRIASLWGRGQIYEVEALRSLALVDYKRAIELRATNPDDVDAQSKARARLAALESGSSESSTVLSQLKAQPPAKSHVEPERRVALVIGNSRYTSVSVLPNPGNDAAAVAAELTHLGFEVTEQHDLGVEGMRRALGEFENRAAGADWALVYYAGHGMELDGQNWLIPVDAVLAKSNDAPDETVSLSRVLDRVRVAKKLRIVILDACRNNPFLSRMIIKAGRSREMNRGLGPVEPEHGEVVFYSARDGNVAADGTGEHSPFTQALLRHLSEEGVEINLFFRKVTSTVLRSTNPQQEPFVYGRLPEESFYFKPSN